MSISSVYEKYFGLEEHPFSITPDPRFVYLSDKHREALEHLKQGAIGGANGFVLLTGDVGTGKTTLCRSFLEQVPPKTEVALILNPVLTLNEFLQTICEELDLVIEGSRESNKNLIDHINRFLVQVYALGQKTILIVDEAQNLSHELLEQIRLLTNLETNSDKLLLIFLIGQPELREMLERPEMQQVSQRITSRYHLGPLDKKETGAYIEKRLEVAGGSDIEFTPSAVRRIYAFSKGVPRLINVLCDKALLCAYENATQKITGKIVKEAEERVRGNQTSSGSNWGRKAAGIAMAGVVLAAIAGLGYWIHLTGWPSGFGPSSQTVAIVDRRATNPAIAPTEPLPNPAPVPDDSAGAADSTLGAPGTESSNAVATSASPQDRSPTAAPVSKGRPGTAAVAAASPSSPVSTSEPQRAAVQPLSQPAPGMPAATAPPPMTAGESPITRKAEVADTTEGPSRTIASASDSERTTPGRREPSRQAASSTTGPAPINAEGLSTSRSDTVANAVTDEPSARAPGATTKASSASGQPPSPVAAVAALESAPTAAPPSESSPSSDRLTEHVEGITAAPGSARSTKGPSSIASTSGKSASGSVSPGTKLAKATRGRTGLESTPAPASRAMPRAKQRSRRAQTLTNYTRKAAEHKLLSLWGIQAEPPRNMSFCRFARQNGLGCLKDNRGLQFLRVYNRPALVSIRVDNLKSYAVVTQATPEKVVLNVLDRTHEIPATLFPKIWDGRFLLLYRAPKGLRAPLTQGARGEGVRKLRELMDQIEGTQTSGDVYDAELVSRVKQFQRSMGLKPDGIVGPRTLVVMRNKVAKLGK